jgi:hypothetical protein
MDAEIIANRWRSREQKPLQMNNSLVWGLVGQWITEFITFFIEMWSPDHIRQWAFRLRSMRLTCKVANYVSQPWHNLLQLCYCYWRPPRRGRGCPIRPWSHFWRPHPWFEFCDWPAKYRALLVPGPWSFGPGHSCFDGLLHPLEFLLRPNILHPEYRDFVPLHARLHPPNPNDGPLPALSRAASQLRYTEWGSPTSSEASQDAFENMTDSDSDSEAADQQFLWCFYRQCDDLRKQNHHHTFEFPYSPIIINDLM